MSAETEPPLQVEIAHVLFIDVVGYSKLLMDDQREHRRIMQALWRADSKAVLQALRTSPYRERRPLEFNTLFGLHLGQPRWH
jgi:hypothetical protein